MHHIVRPSGKPRALPRHIVLAPHSSKEGVRADTAMSDVSGSSAPRSQSTAFHASDSSSASSSFASSINQQHSPQQSTSTHREHHHYYGHIMGLKKFAFIIVMLFLVLVFFETYQKNIPLEIGVLISVITFVYGFFLNSMFGFIQRKYADFATNMADFSANVQALYAMTKLLEQPEFERKMRLILVDFITAVKDLNPRDYAQHQHYIDKLFNVMSIAQLRTKKEEVIYGRILAAIEASAINRERIEIFGERYLVGENKVVFLLLTIIVSGAIIFLSVQSVYLLVLGFVLLFAIVFVTSLLFNIDKMRFGKGKIRMVNLDQLLEAMK